MKVLNVQEAKAQLSRLLEQVARGEEIVIARSGQPIARLVPFGGDERKPGRLAGRVHIPPDYDDPLPDALGEAFKAPE